MTFPTIISSKQSLITIMLSVINVNVIFLLFFFFC